jgi:hypothetical protein
MKVLSERHLAYYIIISTVFFKLHLHCKENDVANLDFVPICGYNKHFGHNDKH